MRSVFYPHLVNGPFGDPALYVRVAHQGTALLFDCGRLDALSVRELLKLSAVLVSHAHIDHVAGFDALLRAFLYTDRELRLVGPSGFADQVAGRLSGYTWNLVDGFPFRLVVREWSEDGSRDVLFRASQGFRGEPLAERPGGGDAVMTTPNWTVRACPLQHGDITSLAFALEETLHVAIHREALEQQGYAPGPWLTAFKEAVRRGVPGDRPVTVPRVDGHSETVDLQALTARIAHTEAGMKLVYVTDVSPVEENLQRIVALARDAHMLVIEAPFAHEDLDRARQRHHLTAQLAGELARQAGAARLTVFHHSPRYQREPERLAEESDRAFRGE